MITHKSTQAHTHVHTLLAGRHLEQASLVLRYLRLRAAWRLAESIPREGRNTELVESPDSCTGSCKFHQ